MQTFLARQPIFSSDRSVYGYELLFRSGRENSFGGTTLDPDLFIASVGWTNALLSGKEVPEMEAT